MIIGKYQWWFVFVCFLLQAEVLNLCLFLFQVVNLAPANAAPEIKL